jgi:hypothetical protein
VSRDPNKLDIFIVSTDGGVYTAAWDQNVANAQWRGWWRIGNLVATPGAPVAVVSRDPNKLDIFVAGSDGRTYTAAWDANVANGAWRGWWNILTGAIPAGGTITPSRHPESSTSFSPAPTAACIRPHGISTGHRAVARWRRVGNLTTVLGAPVPPSRAIRTSGHLRPPTWPE